MFGFLPCKFRIALLVAGTVIGASLYLAAITSAQQNWAPARKGSYGKITRDALDRLLASADKLRAGDSAGANSKLQGMKSDVAELSQATSFFREQANREYDRCVDHIGALDTRVADLYQHETQLKSRIANLEAQLVNVNVTKQLTESQLEALQKSFQATEENLRERQRKLEELKNWWWVPFYGAHLGIRTLVDNDIGRYNSLWNTLNDTSLKLSSNRRELQTITAAKAALASEMATIEKTHGNLQLMRHDAEADLGDLKNAAVFLTDAQVFWGKVNSLLNLNVAQAVSAQDDIAKLQTFLMKENSPPLFNNLQKRPLVELYESLVAFADTLDQGNNFLLAEGSEFCGGPARRRTGANVSSACNIEQFTRYYEIIDPKTCSFRYVNPPGCPPRPKTVNVTEQAMAAARGRGVWARVSNQNWIGRARCESPIVMYYGRMNAPGNCEQACMSDANCASWTYNVMNGYMPGSFHECWGATATLSLNKSKWEGFESGGVSSK